MLRYNASPLWLSQCEQSKDELRCVFSRRQEGKSVQTANAKEVGLGEPAEETSSCLNRCEFELLTTVLQPGMISPERQTEEKREKIQILLDASRVET